MTEMKSVAMCVELAGRFAKRADAHDRDGSFAFENVADLDKHGLGALTVPREHGGMGAGVFETVQALEAISSGDASTGLGCAMQWYATGNLAMQQVWPKEHFARLCKEVVQDHAWVNNAASEPDMGSPSRGGLPVTKAVPVDGGFLITGRKSWVTWAPALTYFILWARVTGQIGVFCVRRDAAGVTLLDNWKDALSLRASGSCDVDLKDVFVPSTWQVEQRDAGQTNTGSLPSGWSTCAFAATYLGIGAQALRSLAKYAHDRIPTALGKPIASLSHIQRIVGQMDVTLRAARTVLHTAARRWDDDAGARQNMTAELSAAKYLCTNASVVVTDLALRAAGASGLDRRLPLERLLRDARAGLMHPPQDEVALEGMGRAVLEAARTWQS